MAWYGGIVFCDSVIERVLRDGSLHAVGITMVAGQTCRRLAAISLNRKREAATVAYGKSKHSKRRVGMPRATSGIASLCTVNLVYEVG